MRGVLLVSLAFLGASTSCMQLVGNDCDALGWDPTPRDTTVFVGQQFTATIRVLHCGDQRELHPTLTWASMDSLVVRVNPQTGVVKAVGVGTARLVVNAEGFGLLPATIVSVR